jgi:hypothetical protein
MNASWLQVSTTTETTGALLRLSRKVECSFMLSLPEEVESPATNSAVTSLKSLVHYFFTKSDGQFMDLVFASSETPTAAQPIGMTG